MRTHLHTSRIVVGINTSMHDIIVHVAPQVPCGASVNGVKFPLPKKINVSGTHKIIEHVELEVGLFQTLKLGISNTATRIVH